MACAWHHPSWTCTWGNDNGNDNDNDGNYTGNDTGNDTGTNNNNSWPRSGAHWALQWQWQLAQPVESLVALHLAASGWRTTFLPSVVVNLPLLVDATELGHWQDSVCLKLRPFDLCALCHGNGLGGGWAVARKPKDYFNTNAHGRDMPIVIAQCPRPWSWGWG